MPCRVDISESERANARNRDLLARLDKLTAENDMYRETILALVKDKDYTLDPKVVKMVATEQTKHRAEDLKRLKEVFTKSRDAERLGLVMLADPKRPLKEQLGFDPDDF